MDVKTAAALLTVVNAVLAVVLALQYRFSRPQPGVGWWAVGQALIAVGLVMGNLRTASFLGHLVIPVYHVLLVAGPLLFYVGIRQFLGKPERRAPIVVLLVAVLVEGTVFTFADESFAARSMALYAAVAVALAMGATAAFRDRTPDVASPALLLGWVLGLTAVWYLGLAVSQAFQTQPRAVTDFTPYTIVSVVYLVEIAAAVLWTFAMVLMINQRLSAKVADDAANLRSVFESIPDSVVLSRLRDGVIVDVNPGFSRMAGYSRTEAVEGALRGMDLWADSEDRNRMVAEVEATGACRDLRARMRLKDGSDLECVLNARTFHLGQEPHLVSVTRDVSQEIAMQEQLRREATTDELTGVANRRHFLALTQAAVTQARDMRSPLMITMLDLDGLKAINDTFGHAGGDAALVAFADVLAASLRDVGPSVGALAPAVLGRVGGDEFALLLPGYDSASGFDVVEGLRRVVEDSPMVFNGAAVILTFSAGVASMDGADDSLEAILARADSALYRAKQKGRNRVFLAPTRTP